MTQLHLHAGDSLLMVLHLAVIALNVFGWAFAPLRRPQRILLVLTACSWLILGAGYGWGYCFLTDWHWDIKRALGETPLPHSFIQYLLRNRLGLNFADSTVDTVAASVLVCVGSLTLVQLYLERRQKRQKEGAKAPLLK